MDLLACNTNHRSRGSKRAMDGAVWRVRHMLRLGVHVFAGLLAMLVALSASAGQSEPMGPEDPLAVAQVKKLTGTGEVRRARDRLALAAGMYLHAGDRVTTGADSSVGITFIDNSLISLGSGTRYTIDWFDFDTTTHEGKFQGRLSRGSLAMVSGKLAKQSEEAVTVKTPSNVLAVRGTRFLVEVGAQQ